MMLGELIAIERKRKGWSLRDLERSSGVSDAQIWQVETLKVRDPGFSTVIRLIDALGISLDRAAGTARLKTSIRRKRGVDKSRPTPTEKK